MGRVIIEVCVDTSESLRAAVAGGADRIELCSALALGGLTPSAGFMAEAAGCGLSVLAMIRPRRGDFVWSPAEVVQMQADIATARRAGLAGVVLGASLPDGRLDLPILANLMQAAAGLEATLHRAFDIVPDMVEALEAAISLGFRRILTSGGAATAVAGADRLTALKAQAAGRIAIMPGAGLSAASVAGIAALRPEEVHGSCSVSRPRSGPVVDLGFGPRLERVTDAAEVQALRAALAALC
jgi:copper homeostasis protein